MKKKLLTLILGLMVSNMYAQDITGQWNGVLKVQGIQLRLVFHIEKSENGYTSTMDSPDQGVKGIPVTKTSFVNGKLTIAISNARIEYVGNLSDDKIIGTFMQAGQSFPMDLSRQAIEKVELKRPQEPVKPYPYYTEEITFTNEKASIKLAGTLSLPSKEGKYPVVVLITGSGPQNRDEELMGHKPFLVLSDNLTRNGIGVLRFDDRGTAKSGGDFKTATTADLATDVEAAISYLKSRKEIDQKKIGLIGHSEGGIIAPMVASKSKDISFIVLLAGTGIPGDQLLLLQQELIGRGSGIPERELLKSKEINKALFEIVVNSTDDDKLKKDVIEFIKQKIKEDPDTANKFQGMSEAAFVNMQADQITSPWMLYFIRLNPAVALQKVKCPVLALNGEKDLQVPPKENLTAIKTALQKGKNKKVTCKELPGLNHLFQECKTGLPAEYSQIEQTFSPDALKGIVEWIKTTVVK